MYGPLDDRVQLGRGTMGMKKNGSALVIPANLRAKEIRKYQLIKFVRALQRAITEECFACMGARSTKRVEACPGARLSGGETCPLYQFRPRGKSK